MKPNEKLDLIPAGKSLLGIKTSRSLNRKLAYSHFPVQAIGW
jgi:hypothetical protein